MPASELPPVGFSTGLYTPYPDTPAERIERGWWTLEAGADAVELHLPLTPEAGDAALAAGLVELAEELRWLSLHETGDPLDAEAIAAAERLHRRVGLDAVVVHPRTGLALGALEASVAPFSLENMDARKAVARDVGYFRRVATEAGLRFTLDLQHAWEHDPSMASAGAFARVMGDRRSHTHVSGEDARRRHAPLTEADNGASIRKALMRVGPVGAVILEGVFEGRPPIEAMARELAVARASLPAAAPRG